MAIDWDSLNNYEPQPGSTTTNRTGDTNTYESTSTNDSGDVITTTTTWDDGDSMEEGTVTTTNHTSSSDDLSDAIGPSYEEQIASEVVSSGGASLENLEQNIRSLPNTTLDGVREQFESMLGGESTPTNEAVTPSLSLPSSFGSMDSIIGSAAGLVIGLIVLAVVFLTPGDR